MSGLGEGFGPAGSDEAESPPFAIAGPSQVTVDASRTGTASFTVSNVTGRAVRVRILVVPGAGADASWFQVSGESERTLATAGTTTIDVGLRIPQEAPTGVFTFSLGAELEESPDKVVAGPTARFDIPEPTKRKFPWWIVIVAAAAVLVLVAGSILIWNVTRTGSPSTATPTPTPTFTPALFRTSAFLARRSAEIVADLDNDQQWGIDEPNRPVRSPDVALVQGKGAGEMILQGYGDTRLAVVSERTYAACQDVAGYDDDSQNIVIDPDQSELFVCARFTDEGRTALLTFGTRIIGRGQIVEYMVWEKTP